MFPGVSKSRIWKKFRLEGLSLIIGNSRKRHGKGKHEKGMDDISEEKRSSGMAPMSETCKETPRISSPHGRVLEIWHEACYPDFFVPISINF